MYKSLSEKKLVAMKDEDWATSLDRSIALGVVRLTFAKSVAFNVKDVKRTGQLMNTLPDMYERPYVVNKVLY